MALEEEIRRLEALRIRNPRGHTFARLADLYRKCGLPEKGLEVVEEGLAHHPHYLNAHLIHGRILRDLGRGPEAAVAFQRVLDIDDENLVAREALTSLEGGRNEDAFPRNEAASPRDQVAQTGDEVAPPGSEATPPRDGAAPSMDQVPSRAPRVSSIDESPSASGLDPPGWLAQLEAEWRRKRMPESVREREGAREAESVGAAPDQEGAETAPLRPADGQVAPDPESTETTLDRAAAHEVAPHPATPRPAPPEASEVATATLAELYLRQGLYEEAISVYEKLLARDPYSARLAASLDEARRLSREGPRRGTGLAPEGPVSDREFPRPGPIPPHLQAVESADRTIREQLTAILEGRAPVKPNLESGALRRLRRWLSETTAGDD